MPESAVTVGVGSIKLLEVIKSKDEGEGKEEDCIELIQASAARIAKPQGEMTKWKNPIKILKWPIA